MKFSAGRNMCPGLPKTLIKTSKLQSWRPKVPRMKLIVCSQVQEAGVSGLSMETVRLKKDQAIPEHVGLFPWHYYHTLPGPFLSLPTHPLGFLWFWKQRRRRRVQRWRRPQECFQLLGRPGGYIDVLTRWIYCKYKKPPLFYNISRLLVDI